MGKVAMREGEKHRGSSCTANQMLQNRSDIAHHPLALHWMGTGHAALPCALKAENEIFGDQL